MARTVFIISALLVLLVGAQASGQDQPPTRTRPPASTGDVDGPARASRPRGPHVDLHIPPPMTLMSLQRWMQPLSLSDAQLAVVEHMFSEYQQQARAKREQLLPALWEWSEAVATAPLHADPAGMSDYADLLQERSRVLRALREPESIIYNGLQPLLSEQQLGLLPAVQARRDRQVYRAIHLWRFPARVDLWESFASLTAKHEVLIEDHEAFDALMRGYELSLTLLLKRVYEAAISGSAERKIAEHLRTGDQASADAADSIRHGGLRAERSIEQLNARYVELLASLLDAGSARALRDQYRAEAHPQVYPDPFALDAVDAAIAAMEQLPEDLQEACRIVLDDSAIRRDAAAEQMISEIDKWIAEFAPDMSINPVRFEMHKRRLDELNQSRRSTSDAAIDQLVEMLAGHASNLAMHRAVRDYHTTVERCKPLTRGLVHYPSGSLMQRPQPAQRISVPGPDMGRRDGS